LRSGDRLKWGCNDLSAEREEGVGLLNVPTVVGNVMLRWESIVLWWFYPRMGLGNESDRSECRDAGSRSGWIG
jgi:hypothetical protein